MLYRYFTLTQSCFKYVCLYCKVKDARIHRKSPVLMHHIFEFSIMPNASYFIVFEFFVYSHASRCTLPVVVSGIMEYENVILISSSTLTFILYNLPQCRSSQC